MKKLFIVGALLFIVGCGGKKEFARDAFDYQGGISLDETKSTDVLSDSVSVMHRMLIKTGTLSMSVSDLQATRAKIDNITKALSAYPSEEGLVNYPDRLQLSLTIRVPSDQYDSLVRSIEHLGEKVENKTVSMQDVTEEFIDTNARLKTKKELETRYSEILRQAKTVNDILAVESHLNTVRGEIESMQGRLKYLSSQISFSTLNLTIYQPLNTDFGFASQFGDGLRNGWANLLSFSIGLVNVWPFLILIGGGVWLFFKWRRKRIETVF